MLIYSPSAFGKSSLVPHFIITVTFADGACEARSRQEEEDDALAIFDDDERRDRPQPPSALRVATGRADGFVAPPSNTQGYGFVVASRPRRRRARHKRDRNYEMRYLDGGNPFENYSIRKSN